MNIPMKNMTRMLAGLLLILLTPSITAYASEPAMDTVQVDVERFQKLAAELRCLVCQNQSLADSHADLAGDMRREIHAMMARGDTDQQIIDFLVERYGDFVRYRPPLKASTVMLWAGPFILLGAGAIMVMVMVRRRARRVSETLTPEEQARLHALIDNDNQGKHS
jgi:cytochrome c-type biogenesis protein CcmH